MNLLATDAYYLCRKGGVSLDERTIILRCQDGELELFEHLYDMYRNDLYRFCLFLAKDPDTAADIFQDTWIKAMKNIQRYDSQRDFLKWLFIIAANLQRDRWRRIKRWALLLQGLQDVEVPAPEEITLGRQDRELLYRCLGNLPKMQRIPLVLHYIEGFKLEEIAELLRIPVGTVKSRLHNGKKKLKDMMEVAING